MSRKNPTSQNGLSQRQKDWVILFEQATIIISKFKYIRLPTGVHNPPPFIDSPVERRPCVRDFPAKHTTNHSQTTPFTLADPYLSNSAQVESTPIWRPTVLANLSPHGKMFRFHLVGKIDHRVFENNAR